MSLARQTFASLAVRNYRLYFFGMLVSATGTWMYQLAVGWLVLDLTGSGTAVGGVVAVQFVPMLVAGVWGGVLADRLDKRRVLYVSRVGMAIVSAVLAAVTLAEVVTVPMAYGASFLIGCFTVIDNPARQAFMSEVVGADRLANAVALNSAMFNAARIIGPSIGGLIILAGGTGACFAYNAVSSAAVIISLARMRADELSRTGGIARSRGQVREGLRYAWSTPALRWPLVLVGTVGIFTLNYSVLLPVFAKITFEAGPGTLGVFTSAMGAGSLTGALVVATRARPTPRLMAASATGLGLAVLAVSAAPVLIVAILALALTGALTTTFLATANALLQLESSDEMRGRVISLYLIVFLGTHPIGSPIVGWIAEQTNPRVALALGGVAALGAGVAGLGLRMRAQRVRDADADALRALVVVEGEIAQAG